LVLLDWLLGTYTLGPQRIYQNSDLASALRGIGLGSPLAASGGREVEFDQVSRATVEPLPGPWQWFDIGHVVISTRAQARALVLRYMHHPRSLAGEIERNAKAAAGVNGGNGQVAPRRLWRSFAWLFVWVAPGLAFLWGCVAAWIGLRLLAAFGPDAVLLGVFIAALITAVAPFPVAIIAFVNWWVGVYVVTNRRVVAHKGVLNVTERVLSLDDVVSASATKAGLARYLGVGNVQVNTAGPTGVVRMVNISEPDWVRQQVLEVQQRVQQSRRQIEFGEISRRLTRTLHLY